MYFELYLGCFIVKIFLISFFLKCLLNFCLVLMINLLELRLDDFNLLI